MAAILICGAEGFADGLAAGNAMQAAPVGSFVGDADLEVAVPAVAVADPEQPRPDAAALPRPPDLFVINKADRLAGPPLPGAVATIATTGDGIDELARMIADRLGLLHIPPDQPWAFCPSLKAALRDGNAGPLR